MPYGGVDTARLLAALADIDTPSGRVLGIDHKGISPMHSLMNARQEMFDNVYWHHTNRACMAMLLRAVQDALDAGLPPSELTEYADVALLDRLSQTDMPDSTRRLVRDSRTDKCTNALSRSLAWRPICMRISVGLFANPARRRDLEHRLVETIAGLAAENIEPADILIDIPKPEKWRSNVWVQFDDSAGRSEPNNVLGGQSPASMIRLY
ncbi:MAG: hypothetical protein R3A46_09185 [Thermomicrobiales bacterium]